MSTIARGREAFCWPSTAAMDSKGARGILTAIHSGAGERRRNLGSSGPFKAPHLIKPAPIKPLPI
eukprot:3982658-Pyramimonas_sp.AAC.1